MILAEIRRYLMERKRATLGDLALHFDTEPDAMRGMLEQWIRKGKVLRLDIQGSCGKACSTCCCDSAVEIYEWSA
ncbi:MAG: FeoC-like transcriptional regulator [Deltaproteobacteria bacterium]|nr:FeoC-like transcriptional regulator [Deltaproteobacteria bacterium]